jgi:hypothetical protein
MGAFLIPAFVVIAASNAAPHPPHVPPIASLSVEYGLFLFMNAAVGPTAHAIGATERVSFASGFEFAFGLRALVASQFPAGAAMEGFGRVGFGPRLGAWNPGLALELGVTAANRIVLDTVSTAPGNDLRNRGEASPLFVAFDAAPLRFRFGRFGFAIASIAAGTDLVNPGRVLRVQLTAVQLAWSFR